jgi:hypothetical protein
MVRERPVNHIHAAAISIAGRTVAVVGAAGAGDPASPLSAA